MCSFAVESNRGEVYLPLAGPPVLPAGPVAPAHGTVSSASSQSSRSWAPVWVVRAETRERALGAGRDAGLPVFFDPAEPVRLPAAFRHPLGASG